MLKLVYTGSLFPNMTILDMQEEGMTCIDFDTLSQMKNLEEIRFQNGHMPYFPDKDCNNSVHEEDTRVLDLPNLKILILMNIQLQKAPNSSLMPKLEQYNLNVNPIKEILETQFINNGHLRQIQFYKSKLSVVPVIRNRCSNLISLNLNTNNFSKIPDDYFNGCGSEVTALRFNNTPSGSPILAISQLHYMIVHSYNFEIVIYGLTSLLSLDREIMFFFFLLILIYQQ